ncbi:MAG: hypothetical protein PHG00_07440 [Methylococcales bacterium]|nr:hypothetical protein [Methylococcales bacterium]
MQAAKKLFLVSLIALCLLAAYTSIRWAIANILETQIRHQLGKAHTTGLSSRQWRLTHDMLQNTLQLHPDYSGTLELAVFFHKMAASRPQALLDELGWHDNQQQALEYARSALLKRPSWPYLWDDFIQGKIKLKQFDEELTDAMERAVTLGPWEESVQEDVAFYGLDNLENLPPAAQQIVLNAMEQTLSMQKDKKSLYQDIQESANNGKLCQTLTPESELALGMLKKYCQQSNSAEHAEHKAVKK